MLDILKKYQNLIYYVMMGGKDLEGADDNSFPWYFTEDVTSCILYTSPSPRDS